MTRNLRRSHHGPRIARMLMADPLLEPAPAAPPADPVGAARALLDEAHRELGADVLGEVLTEIQRSIRPLLAARAPAPPRRGVPALGRPSPAARAYVQPIRLAVAVAAARRGGPRPEERRRALGAELELLLDELAARPRGSAVPAT